MSEEPLLWWLTRSSGLVAMMLLTAAVVLGGTATWGTPAGRATRQGLHRWASGTALALIAVHVGSSVADGFVALSPLDVVVPFVAGYSRVWVGLGTLAVDLLLAVLVTSLLRHRLQGRHWRRVHVLAYGAWPLALVHGLGAGTDVRTTIVRALTAGCVTAVLLLVVAQLARTVAPARLAVLVAVLAASGAAAGWAVAGPLSPGWSP